MLAKQSTKESVDGGPLLVLVREKQGMGRDLGSGRGWRSGLDSNGCVPSSRSRPRDGTDWYLLFFFSVDRVPSFSFQFQWGVGANHGATATSEAQTAPSGRTRDGGGVAWVVVVAPWGPWVLLGGGTLHKWTLMSTVFCTSKKVQSIFISHGFRNKACSDCWASIRLFF